MYDVLIAGGGTAGLSAALVLGRARRQVLVCGEGTPRNAPSAHAHGFFTQDGTAPSELLRIGREQLRPYDGVQYREVAVADASRHGLGDRVEAAGADDRIAPLGAAPRNGHFAVTLGDGEAVQARHLLLATGVVDTLPAIPGLAELWGTAVFHCPYCHGWEVRDQPLAVLNNGLMGVEQALLISQWSRDLVLCTDGPVNLTDHDRGRLAARGIRVREGRIARLEGGEGRLERLLFADGEALARRGLFVAPAQRQRSDLAARLGCTLTSPIPGWDVAIISVDGFGYTGIPGLYAAGGVGTPVQQVATAAASGVMAAAGINRDLLRLDLEDGYAA